MVIAASVPRSIDELEPPPLRNRLQEIPMPVGAGNVDRGIGGFLPEMRMQIGPPAAHDKRIGFQRMTGKSKLGGLRHVVSRIDRMRIELTAVMQPLGLVIERQIAPEAVLMHEP